MTTLFELHEAVRIINKVAQDLRDVPEKRLIVDLIKALEKIDRSFVSEFEDNADLSNENDLIMRSFYIEADDWVDVHACLRRLVDGEAS